MSSPITMRFNTRIIVLFLSFLALLIVFDALQQKYYIDNFNLTSEPIYLLDLLVNHLIRWMIWLVTAIPIGIYLWKFFDRTQGKVDLMHIVQIQLVVVPGLLLALLLVSFQVTWAQGLPVTPAQIKELYLFFIYQKGLTFFLAYGALTLTMLDQVRNSILSRQQAELLFLKQTHTEDNHKEKPLLQVKTGHRLKTIPLEEIVWIQADDYCVKVHTTHEESFTLRKSMKYLEEQLAEFKFIRVHRGALSVVNSPFASV
jgi:hypothetical protein